MSILKKVNQIFFIKTSFDLPSFTFKSLSFSIYYYEFLLRRHLLRKNNKYSNENTSSTDARESYLKNLELALADLEKIGALFISFGYLNFFSAANLDTLNILDINNTGRTPEEVFIYGQELITIGYTILWIVSINRYSEELFRINNAEETFLLPAFQQLKESYLISLFANLYRLDAFIQIYKDSLQTDSDNTNEDSTQKTESDTYIF